MLSPFNKENKKPPYKAIVYESVKKSKLIDKGGYGCGSMISRDLLHCPLHMKEVKREEGFSHEYAE